MHLAGWIPLRAALAWVVTRDEDLVKWVLSDPAFDAPAVLASSIRDEMHEAGCFVDKPIASEFGGEPPPIQEELAKEFSGRFQELAQAFEDERLGRPGGELCPREYLLSRIEVASKNICRRIGHRELQARGVAVDGDAVGRARDILPSEITDTMVLSHEHDQAGWLLQEPREHSSGTIPAIKSLTVLGEEFVKCFPVSKMVGETSQNESMCTKLGRHPAYPWDKCREAVMEKLRDEGVPTADSDDDQWRTQVDLECFIANWMLKRRGEEAQQPAESTIRNYANSWLKEFKAEKAGK